MSNTNNNRTNMNHNAINKQYNNLRQQLNNQHERLMQQRQKILYKQYEKLQLYEKIDLVQFFNYHPINSQSTKQSQQQQTSSIMYHLSQKFKNYLKTLTENNVYKQQGYLIQQNNSNSIQKQKQRQKQTQYSNKQNQCKAISQTGQQSQSKHKSIVKQLSVVRNNHHIPNNNIPNLSEYCNTQNNPSTVNQMSINNRTSVSGQHRKSKSNRKYTNIQKNSELGRIFQKISYYQQLNKLNSINYKMDNISNKDAKVQGDKLNNFNNINHTTNRIADYESNTNNILSPQYYNKQSQSLIQSHHIDNNNTTFKLNLNSKNKNNYSKHNNSINSNKMNNINSSGNEYCNSLNNFIDGSFKYNCDQSSYPQSSYPQSSYPQSSYPHSNSNQQNSNQQNSNQQHNTKKKLFTSQFDYQNNNELNSKIYKQAYNQGYNQISTERSNKKSSQGPKRVQDPVLLQPSLMKLSPHAINNSNNCNKQLLSNKIQLLTNSLYQQQKILILSELNHYIKLYKQSQIKQLFMQRHMENLYSFVIDIKSKHKQQNSYNKEHNKIDLKQNKLLKKQIEVFRQELKMLKKMNNQQYSNFDNINNISNFENIDNFNNFDKFNNISNNHSTKKHNENKKQSASPRKTPHKQIQIKKVDRFKQFEQQIRLMQNQLLAIYQSVNLQNQFKSRSKLSGNKQQIQTQQKLCFLSRIQSLENVIESEQLKKEQFFHQVKKFKEIMKEKDDQVRQLKQELREYKSGNNNNHSDIHSNNNNLNSNNLNSSNINNNPNYIPNHNKKTSATNLYPIQSPLHHYQTPSSNNRNSYLHNQLNQHNQHNQYKLNNQYSKYNQYNQCKLNNANTNLTHTHQYNLNTPNHHSITKQNRRTNNSTNDSLNLKGNSNHIFDCNSLNNRLSQPIQQENHFYYSRITTKQPSQKSTTLKKSQNKSNRSNRSSNLNQSQVIYYPETQKPSNRYINVNDAHDNDNNEKSENSGKNGLNSINDNSSSRYRSISKSRSPSRSHRQSKQDQQNNHFRQDHQKSQTKYQYNYEPKPYQRYYKNDLNDIKQSNSIHNQDKQSNRSSISKKKQPISSNDLYHRINYQDQNSQLSLKSRC